MVNVVETHYYLVQQILLDYLVHDDGDQEVEDDGWNVLEAGIVVDLLMNACGAHDRYRDIMVQRDEE